MMKRVPLLGAFAASILLTTTSSAALVSWNTQGVGTDVANGILSLDELQSSNSHTYENVAGAGFDVTVSSSSVMDYSTGDLNYVRPNQSLLFEFFDTASGDAIEVTGFAADWRDLDTSNGGTAGTFTIRDLDGNATILNTSSSAFALGSSLSMTDWEVNNGVDPDAVSSSGNGNWDNVNLAFITDLSSTPIHSFSLDNTTDWIAPTSLRLDVDIIPSQAAPNPLPEPTTLVIWSVLGIIAVTAGRYRRRSAS